MTERCASLFATNEGKLWTCARRKGHVGTHLRGRALPADPVSGEALAVLVQVVQALEPLSTEDRARVLRQLLNLTGCRP